MGDRILHILFDGPDDMATRIIREQSASGMSLKVMDMVAGDITADDLVDEIFAADKVFSWHA